MWSTKSSETILQRYVFSARSDTITDTQGDMHNREGLTLKLIWKAATDYHLWPMYLISFCFNLPAVPIGQYLQISFRQLGFSRIMANLLAAPHTVLTVVTLLGITVLSEAVNNRSFVCMTQSIVSHNERHIESRAENEVVPASFRRFGPLAQDFRLAVLFHLYRSTRIPMGPCYSSIMVF